MPQVLKDEIRARILDAALEVFAADAFTGATMASIAGRAGLGTASLYRYYACKEDLFAAVVPPELARRFEALLDRRIRALARGTLRGEPTDDLGGEMLQFWLENRLAVVILLDRAAGTPHETYGQRFVDQLTKHTIGELRTAHPRLKITPTARFVLVQIFENTRRLLASVLERHADRHALEGAIQAFWSYQIAGLRGLSEWLVMQ